MAITNLKTISQLPEISSLPERAFIGVSVPSEYDLDDETIIYASKKISKLDFGNVMVKQVSSYYETSHGISSNVHIGKLWSDFYRFSEGPEFDITNSKITFEGTAPKINDTITDYFDNDNQKKAVNLETLKGYSATAVSPSIGPNFGFVTSLSSNEPDTQVFYNLYKIKESGSGSNKQYVTDGNFNWGLLPDIKYTSENQFLFQIKPGDKESNVWYAPASGIFTCYGWLDEIQTEKMSNESRWVALMGYKEFSDGSRWVILQLQPFVSNNYLSYVGFTFPVQAGMPLKIQTGFTVGSNSGLYFNLQSSIANHMANSFFGGIYTNLSVAQNIEYSLSNVSEVLENRLERLEENVEELNNTAVKYIGYKDTTIKNIAIIRCVQNSGTNPIFDYRNITQDQCGGITNRYSSTAKFVDLTSNQDITIADCFNNAASDPRETIFSDGMYYYYRTMYDSTVRITLMEILTRNYAYETFCAMIPTTSVLVKNGALVYLTKLNHINSLGRETRNPSITIDAKAGTIFVFGMYMREKLRYVSSAVNTELKNNPLFTDLRIYASGPQFGIESLPSFLTDSLDTSNPFNQTAHYAYDYIGTDGNEHDYITNTYRLNADGSNLNNVFKTSGGTDNDFKYDYPTSMYRNLANIVEMI